MCAAHRVLHCLELAFLVDSKAPSSSEDTGEPPVEVMEAVVAVFVRVLT